MSIWAGCCRFGGEVGGVGGVGGGDGKGGFGEDVGKVGGRGGKGGVGHGGRWLVLGGGGFLLRGVGCRFGLDCQGGWSIMVMLVVRRERDEDFAWVGLAG